MLHILDMLDVAGERVSADSGRETVAAMLDELDKADRSLSFPHTKPEASHSSSWTMGRAPIFYQCLAGSCLLMQHELCSSMQYTVIHAVHQGATSVSIQSCLHLSCST
jgi:hypothetical protein